MTESLTSLLERLVTLKMNIVHGLTIFSAVQKFARFKGDQTPPRDKAGAFIGQE